MSDLKYTARLDESDDSVMYSDEYAQHISAMTSEQLNSKSDIACELAARDIKIGNLEQQLKQQWVSVDDVPIKESDMKGHYETVDVILSSPDGTFSGEFKCGKTIGYWSKFTSDGMVITNATHYMLIDSLPKPPTK